jgi:hypothetical protein
MPFAAPRFAIHALLLALSLALLAGPGRTAADDDGRSQEALNPDWELVSDRKGIQVYMRHDDDSRLKTFRGVTRMKLEDEYAMVALLNDYDAFPKWLHFIDGAEEIKRNGPLQRYLRFTTNLPWPLKDREAVLRADVVQRLNSAEDSVMIHMTNTPGLIPPDDDYVRFPELRGVFGARRLANQQVEVIYELVLDPGGYIPAWLANILLRDAPYFTLQRMRRIILRPEYQNKYFDYIDLRGPGRPQDADPDTSRYKPAAMDEPEE